MHHVRIALDVHQVFHLHRAVFAHPPQIVAAEIDQHDVLGAFFFVAAHLLFQSAVFGLVAAARMSSGDRPIFQLASGHPHQHLRRRAQNVRIAHAQKIQIGRGIHLPQRAVYIERRDFRNEIEALRQHDLENVSGGNVFLAALDAAQKTLAAGAGVNLELACLRLRRSCARAQDAARAQAFFPARLYREPRGRRLGLRSPRETSAAATM